MPQTTTQPKVNQTKPQPVKNQNDNQTPSRFETTILAHIEEQRQENRQYREEAKHDREEAKQAREEAKQDRAESKQDRAELK